MELNFTERIRVIMRRKGITAIELAERLGMSRQNLDRRMRINSWTESEMIRIAEAVGCAAVVTITDTDSGEAY